MNTLEYHKMARLEDLHWWFLTKRLFIASVFPRKLSDQTILDIGAGSGGLTRWLSRYGRVVAVEQSHTGVTYLREKHINVIHNMIQKVKFQPQSFDIVCAFDVLYHNKIRDERIVLRQVMRWLKPGGYFCITDCALPWLSGPHDVVMHARKRFTRPGLRCMLESEGFAVSRSSYMYFFVFPLVVLMRGLQHVYSFPSVSSVPVAINSLLIMICAAESILLRYMNFPIGSSIIMVARKRV